MAALMRRLRCGAGGGAAAQAELREQEDLEDLRLRRDSSTTVRNSDDGVAAELPGDPPPYEYAVARLHHRHHSDHPSLSSSPSLLLVPLNECPEPHFYAVQFQVHASVSEPSLHDAQLQQRRGFSSATTCLATTAAVAACCVGGSGGNDGDAGCDDSPPPPPAVVAAGGAKSYSALLCHTPQPRGGGEKEVLPVQWFKISLQFGSGKVLTSLVQQWEGDDFCNTARWMTLPRPAAAAEECELDLADCIAALFHSARVEEMSPSTSFIATATVQTPRHPDVLNVHVHVPNSPAVRLREAGLDCGDGDGDGNGSRIKGESKQERMRRCRGAFLGALRHAQGESAKVEHLVSHSRGDVVREAARLCFAIARLDRPCVTWIRAAAVGNGGGDDDRR